MDYWPRNSKTMIKFGADLLMRSEALRFNKWKKI